MSSVSTFSRMEQYLIQNSPTIKVIEYRRIKGLILNIQKRFMWYTAIENKDELKLLLIKSSINNSDRNKYFFHQYIKIVLKSEKFGHFITIPLVDLNVRII